MSEHLGIEFTEVGPNYIRARMPVNERTRQPYGKLHGGASAALAETLGSIGSAMIVDPTQYRIVGLELNANHIKGVASGWVMALCKPIHTGKSTHVWNIEIYDENEQIVCVSRLTVMILRNNE